MSDDLQLIPLDTNGFWAFLFETGSTGLVPTGGFVSEQRIGDLRFVRVDVPMGDGRLQPRVFPLSQISVIIPSTEEKVRSHEKPT